MIHNDNYMIIIIDTPTMFTPKRNLTISSICTIQVKLLYHTQNLILCKQSIIIMLHACMMLLIKITALRELLLVTVVLLVKYFASAFLLLLR